MILTQTAIKNIVDFSSVKVFEDATVNSAITILQKSFNKNNTFKVSLNSFDDVFEMSQSDLTKNSFTFISHQELAIKKKIEQIGTLLKEWNIKINYGIIKIEIKDEIKKLENIINEAIDKIDAMVYKLYNLRD